MATTKSAVVSGDCGDVECDACHFTRVQGVAHSAKKCINAGGVVGSGRVQAPAHVRSGLVAPIIFAPVEPLTVTVDLADALGVGLQLEMMILQGIIPALAAPPTLRIAKQLVAAARAAAKAVAR